MKIETLIPIFLLFTSIIASDMDTLRLNKDGNWRNVRGQIVPSEIVERLSRDDIWVVQAQTDSTIIVKLTPQGGSFQGKRNKRDVTKILMSGLRKIQNDYVKMSLRYPSAEGKILVRFKISPKGKVIEAAIIEDEIGVEDFESRLIRRIRKVDFGPSEFAHDTTTVSYPFVFSRSVK